MTIPLLRPLALFCILTLSFGSSLLAQQAPTPTPGGGFTFTTAQAPDIQLADRDGDGVPDISDLCPDTGGYPETDGCPRINTDSDGDGVWDHEDECPFEAGSPENNGCPPPNEEPITDNDGDGIRNPADQCPDEAGPLENHGCPLATEIPPDADGDGVPDAEDECPDQHHNGAIFNGCPDTDGDGLVDNIDACPDEAGPAETQGCPLIPLTPLLPTVLPTQPPVAQPTSQPPTLPPLEPGPPEGIIPVDPSDVGLNPNDIFADCPQLIEPSAVFPIYVLSYLQGTDDPCANGQDMVDVEFFPIPGAADALGMDAIQEQMEGCPASLASNLQHLERFERPTIQAELASQQVDIGCAQTLSNQQEPFISFERVCYLFIGEASSDYITDISVPGVITLDGVIPANSMMPVTVPPTVGMDIDISFFDYGPKVDPSYMIIARGSIGDSPAEAEVEGFAVGLAPESNCEVPDDPTDNIHCFTFDIEVTNPDPDPVMMWFMVFHLPDEMIAATYFDVAPPGDSAHTVYAIGVVLQQPLDLSQIFLGTQVQPFVIVNSVSLASVHEPSHCQQNAPEPTPPPTTPTPAPTQTPDPNASPTAVPTTAPTNAPQPTTAPTNPPQSTPADPNPTTPPSDTGDDGGEGVVQPVPGDEPNVEAGLPPPVAVGGILAVFEVQEPFVEFHSDLYMLENEVVVPLIANTPRLETNPRLDRDGAWVVYVETDIDANFSRKLRMIHTQTRRIVDLISDSPELQIMPVDPTWMPNEDALMFSAWDAAGVPNVYRIELVDEQASEPELVLEDASYATISADGRYIAFVRAVDGVNAIYSYTPINGNIVPIHNQPGNQDCDQPAFGTNPLLLTFVCTDDGLTIVNMYLYQLGGTSQVDLPERTPVHPQPGPTSGFLAYTAGGAIWFSDEAGANRNILVQFGDGKFASNLSWVMPS